MIRRVLGCVAGLLALGICAGSSQTPGRVGDLTTHQHDVSVPLVGFGIVYGLEGTGDRNLGGFGSDAAPNARAIANLLRRFDIAVPAELLRTRNVAAVLVEAEVSPYLRAGSRFDLHVSSIQDATSLRGGRLFMMPFVTNPGTAPVAVGSGRVLVTTDPASRLTGRGGTSGRVPTGGLMEVDLPRPETPATPLLNVNRPDVGTAIRITTAINDAYGNGVAATLDPGTIQLNPPAQFADNLIGFYAEIDTLTVGTESQPRIIISQLDGSVATVGNIVIGQATVSHAGITLSVGDDAGDGEGSPGLFQAAAGTSVHDIAAGLHAAGAQPRELAAIFDLLRQAGALNAEVTVN